MSSSIKAGIKLIIHHQNDSIIASNMGQEYGTGYEHFIAVVQVSFQIIGIFNNKTIN